MIQMQIPLSGPDIDEKDIQGVVNVLKSRFLSIGPKIVEFEKKMAEYMGRKYAMAVNSGTSALHLIVRSLGIGEGDLVITTSFSFIASSNCLLFEKAVPVFVDIEPDTLNLDPEKVESKIHSMKREEISRLKALLIVDVFSHPARWDRFKELADKYSLRLIEDSAEALGSEYKGQKAGNLGEVGVFAFYPNKQITTGEGGMIITDDEKISQLCQSMRSQGRGDSGEWLKHVRVGYNYRMSELAASLGCSQLNRLEEIIIKRNQVAQQYNQKLEEIEEVETPYVADYVSRLSWFVYVIRLKKGISRDQIMQHLNQEGVQCKPYFTPIHLQQFYQKMFGYKEGDFPITEDVAGRTIALPFFNNLKEEQIDYVVEKLKEGIKNSI